MKPADIRIGETYRVGYYTGRNTLTVDRLDGPKYAIGTLNGTEPECWEHTSCLYPAKMNITYEYKTSQMDCIDTLCGDCAAHLFALEGLTMFNAGQTMEDESCSLCRCMISSI